MAESGGLRAFARTVEDCRKCERLVAWRERVAREKRASYSECTYWGKPVPSLGPGNARLLVLGLAPAAHGANRTGRMFTGDRSGDWLFEAMHATGFSTQAMSRERGDGLRMVDARVSAVVRCAPPDNKPTTQERDQCMNYLYEELGLMRRVRVVLALGGFAWAGALKALARHGHEARPKPKFGHGARHEFEGLTLLGSYHPSQQNTFTGRLTRPMLRSVFAQARAVIDH